MNKSIIHFLIGLIFVWIYLFIQNILSSGSAGFIFAWIIIKIFKLNGNMGLWISALSEILIISAIYFAILKIFKISRPFVATLIFVFGMMISYFISIYLAIIFLSSTFL